MASTWFVIGFMVGAIVVMLVWEKWG